MDLFLKNGDNPVNGTINPETGEIASSKDSLKKKDNINNNNEKLKFATLDDFISENKKRDKDDQYDRGLKIETLPEDDKKFIDQGETNYQKPYSLHENENGENCGDLVGNIVINAAVDGVHGNKDGIFGFTIPNWQYEKFSKENPNAIEIDVLRSSDER